MSLGFKGLGWYWSEGSMEHPRSLQGGINVKNRFCMMAILGTEF